MVLNGIQVQAVNRLLSDNPLEEYVGGLNFKH